MRKKLATTLLTAALILPVAACENMNRTQQRALSGGAIGAAGGAAVGGIGAASSAAGSAAAASSAGQTHSQRVWSQ